MIIWYFHPRDRICEKVFVVETYDNQISVLLPSERANECYSRSQPPQESSEDDSLRKDGTFDRNLDKLTPSEFLLLSFPDILRRVADLFEISS